MKNSVSIWYAVVLSLTLTSCFQTKEGKPTKTVEAEKPIVVPQVNPAGQTAPTVQEDKPEVKPKSEVTTQDQSKLACIQSLCGTEYVLTPEHVKHPEVLVKNLKVVDDKLGRTVELKMGQAIKNHMTAGDMLKTITANQAESIQFTQEQIGFLNAYKYLNQIQKFYASIEYNSAGKLIFNKEKLKKNNPDLSELEIEAIESLSSAFQVGDLQNVDSLTYKSMLSQLKMRYLKIEGIKIANEEDVLMYVATAIEYLRLDVFSKVYIKELLVNEIQHVVDKALDKKELTMKEKLDLLRKYASYFFINDLITNEKIQTAFRKLPFSGAEVLAGINKNLKSTFQDTYVDKSKFKATYAAELLACKTDLAKSLTETPTAQEIQRAEALTALVAEKANTVINRKSMQSTALSIEFIMPKNQEEVLKDWEVKFNSDLKQAVLIQKTIKNLPASSLDGKFLTTLAVLYGRPSGMFESVRTDCKTEEPSFLSDAALPSDKKFRASSVVVKNIDAALGVVVHEVGHIVQFFKEDLFKNELSCLESNYGSKQYLGEDFADLFSAKVMSELYGEKKISVNKNMACSFPEFKTLKLSDLKLAGSKSDEHSSGLYRLLAVSAATGSVTNQCSSYLTQHESQTKVFDNYCKWQE